MKTDMEISAEIVEFAFGWSFFIDINKTVSIEPYRHYKSKKMGEENLLRWLKRLHINDNYDYPIPVIVKNIKGKIIERYTL